MTDDDSSKSFWPQITGPWDWVAAGVGALAGGVFSLATGGADLGTSIGGGAVAGVTARKAAVASLQGRLLRRKAAALQHLISERAKTSAGFSALLDRVVAEIELWDRGAMGIDEFEKQLARYREEYRKLIT